MSPEQIEWNEARLAALRGVAEAAGAAIMGVYARLAGNGAGGEAVQVQHKADDSPVTEADLAADRLIRSRLRIMFNGGAVLSEEGDPAADVVDPALGYFLVDPLDGTKEFLARNGEFTVNIAWVRAGRPLAGVVHAPALGETFWGAAGVGAWKASLTGGVESVPQPIHIAPVPPVGTPLRVLASRSHGGAAQRGYLARLAARLPQPPQCIEAGSSLKFCRVAEGAADLYPRLTATMAWDTAAGQAVLEAAGGVVLGTEGAPLRVPGRPREAPNPPFFAASSAGLALRAVKLL
ncbi:MAG: 3'(2'),5'-bisphosphate nucleotidase CysQ [Rubrivivax sp.]